MLMQTITEMCQSFGAQPSVPLPQVACNSMFSRHFVMFVCKYAEYEQTHIALVDNKQDCFVFLFIRFP
jgi:hypothetical protein